MSNLLTARETREITMAIRHIGRAMKALERSGLRPPTGSDEASRWLIERGQRSLFEASDRLISAMESVTGATRTTGRQWDVIHPCPGCEDEDNAPHDIECPFDRSQGRR